MTLRRAAALSLSWLKSACLSFEARQIAAALLDVFAAIFGLFFLALFGLAVVGAIFILLVMVS